MIKKKALLILILLLGFGCSGSNIEIVEVQATVVDGSNQAGFENCGWLLFFDGENYKPNYLPPDYQQDGLQVLVKLELLTEQANCSTTINPISKVRIEQISEQE